jgi:formylglycine-generating enzyme required for sulfatase activity
MKWAARQSRAAIVRMNEEPKHRETVSDFYMSETEVTQRQWRAVMGSDPERTSKHRLRRMPGGGSELGGCTEVYPEAE